MTKLQYRSVFISDVHLGTKNCKADFLLDFLQHTESDTLYLVGDIFDFYEMQSRVSWNELQSNIISEILRKAGEGTRVIFIPGNHDSWVRKFAGGTYSGVEVMLNVIHTTADGRRFFVSHGDEFDTVVRHNQVLKYIGNYAYYCLLSVNRLHKRLLHLLRRPYWSLSGHLKSHVGTAKRYINQFQSVAAQAAKDQGVDGYICGHIHKADIRIIDDILYCNTGDWVEHCTALTEDDNGCLQLLHWSDHARVETVIRGEEIDTLPFPIDKPVLASSLTE